MMEPFKITLHELLTIGCIIASVTTAYVLLSADVKDIKSDIIDLKVGLDQVQKEQFRVNYVLGLKDSFEISQQEKDTLRKELEKKPWRSK